MNERVLDLFFCILCILTVILLLSIVARAQDDALQIILCPYAKVSEAFFGMRLSYMAGTGYASPDGTFAIGRECAGEKFIALLFSMSLCMFIKHFMGFGRKALWFLSCLSGSVIVGLLTGSMRIIGSIPFAPHEKFPLIHISTGVFFNFAALVACYGLLNKYLINKEAQE